MNYSKGIKTNSTIKTSKTTRKNASKSRLGLKFEDLINKTNRYYLDNDICVVYKKPTPIKVTKVSYPTRSKAKITEAFYQIPSTTDYNGIYNGKYLDFEAKSCNGKSFPFSNIYIHQIDHLKKVDQHGGIAFLLIMFNDYQEVYLLDAKILIKLYNDSLNGNRKSIPYNYFKEHAEKITIGNNNPIDYIEAVKKIYF
ncbi:MAG: Holliday junction resolvase RecU [Bacilli bacterium]|nr:Holliday junction resolvase RecU [Bacilli bacterium]